jgi:GxxExxY protein
MLRRDPIHEELTRSVIGAFYDAYNTLGFGFLEHVCVRALERELHERGHRIAREVGVTIMYKGHALAVQRLDMVVDETLVVETKSTYELRPVASRQLFDYLRASRLDVGLLLHFGPKPRVHRVVCRHHEISVQEERSD